MGGLRRRTLGIVVALAALGSLGYVALDPVDDARALTPDAPPRELYARADRCDTPCATLATAEAFHVAADVREVELVIYAQLDAQSGPVRISVIDPSGDVRYDEVFSGAPERSAREDVARWAAEIGEWTIARSYVGAVGRVEAQVWGEVA